MSNVYRGRVVLALLPDKLVVLATGAAGRREFPPPGSPGRFVTVRRLTQDELGRLETALGDTFPWYVEFWAAKRKALDRQFLAVAEAQCKRAG